MSIAVSGEPSDRFQRLNVYLSVNVYGVIHMDLEEPPLRLRKHFGFLPLSECVRFATRDIPSELG
ncbi:MAG: hypothetical protein VX822_03580 [Candidatus Neomarinimicrobiota bacterium]|nr:hypothetical protein [Candidatus Neomarinimicrobiota bacterium]